MWILVVVLVLLLTLCYLKWYQQRKKYAKFYNLPKPKAYPVIGHTYLFVGKQFFDRLQDVFTDIGLPCLLYSPEPHYCTADPEEIKILLNHPNVMTKNVIYRYFYSTFKDGLIFAPADIWKPNRKLLSKAFNKTVLDSLVPIFYKNSCILKESLMESNDLWGAFEKFSLDNFLESSGGISLNGATGRVVELFTHGQAIIVNRATSPTLMYDFIFRWTKEGKLLSSYIAEFYKIIMDIIKEKNLNTQERIDSLARLPLLDLLMRLKKEGKYNDEQIFNEISTFVAAATDTTGYTLASVCTLLGMHPHFQEKVFQEVMTVIGPNKEIEYTDLPKLKYTEMVILETMRILPTVPTIGRQTDVDVDIGHCVIPSGSNIVVSIFNLHRNEKYYPNPTEFDPNRFSPEEIEKRDPNTYVPFSIGPRNCIGWIYSLMLMKITIANVVRDYKIASKHKSVTEFNFESNLVMKITPHPDCRFVKR